MSGDGASTLNLPSPQEIEDGFAALDDWEERFTWLLDLGGKLPELDAKDQVEANLVKGCQSQVWLAADAVDDDAGTKRLHVRARSDAKMVDGLIAIMLALYDGRTLEEARAIDPDAFLARLHLAEHLSPTRRNGLMALIERLKTLTRH